MRGRFDPEHLGSEHNVVAYTSAVPKQESTGDRTILGKISKRGNKYMRTLFVQGRTRRSGAAAEHSKARSVALDRSRHRSGCTATCWRSQGQAYQPRIAANTA